MVVIKIGEDHGQFQSNECVDLKKQLMLLESQKDGCIPMSNFYKAIATENKWQFSETPAYLKELGALDESDPDNLRVMIPNYLDGASNCVATSSYYSVCCINEGEELLGSIEKHFQAPDVTPDALARFVADLPSSTVSAGRTLPQPLIQKLEQIAAVHGGHVPLQGRLFMQWMHNAYPHEVPYPFLSGKKHPRLPEVYIYQEHKDPNLSQKQAQDILKADAEKLPKQGACGQWLYEEELYVPWKEVHPTHELLARRLGVNDANVWLVASSSSMALVAAVAVMIFAVVRGAISFRAASDSLEKEAAIVGTEMCT